MKSRPSKPLRPLRRPLPIVLGAVILAVLLIGGALWVYSSNHGSKTVKPSATPTPSNYIPTPPPSPSNGPGSDTNVHAGPGSQTTTPSPTTPTPVANPDHPITNTLSVRVTVSDHGTGSNGPVPRSVSEDSTCITVMGASCYIQATKNGQTIIVSDTKTVNDAANGVDLPWSVGKLPSGGAWSIQAVAKTSDGRQGISSAEVIQVAP